MSTNPSCPGGIGALAAGLVIILAWSPVAGLGQEPVSDVRGTVVDASTNVPIVGAEVDVIGQNLLAISEDGGRFTLSAVRLPIQLRVSMLGYRTSERYLESARGIEIRLQPEPVMLEGLEVVANRFDARLRSLTTSTRVIDEASIATANALHGVDVLQQRAGFREVPCRRERVGGVSRCFASPEYRGSFTLYIDDQRSPFGLEELSSIRKRDIWRIELIGSRQVRVYTKAFVDRAARLVPLNIPEPP